jgi:hypothetical protein
MYSSSLNYKFVFILTLFNTFICLLDSGSNLLADIEDNYIGDIVLNSSEPFTINLDLKEKELIHLSLISYDKSNFTIIDTNIKFQTNASNTTNSYLREIDISMIKNGDKPYISISSEKDNTIQIIHIKNTTDSLYCKVKEDDDETIKIKKKYYNFVKFIGDDKTIKVDIKFKDNLKNNISYGIVRLLSKNEKYIPRVETFKEKGLIDKYDNEKMKKEKTITIKKINHEKDDEDNGIYTAFILSINSSATFKDYSIIINEDIMNNFLLGSIIVALIFAVITFFLIRRKQNVGEKKTGEEFYEEKQEEEKET